ncbi:MAG: DUF4176 domain-containing protein [Lachnospiraceae bacterium]|jgi:hypothetical protein|nr:DUF4176 domain-containing protein [Lachnospiraceae bacterium]
MKNLLPVGSVIYLQDGNVKLVIIGVCQVTEQESGERPAYFDYVASEYPGGLNPESVYYFNEENIDKVIYEGYKTDEHENYVKDVEEWMEENEGTFEIGKIE